MKKQTKKQKAFEQIAVALAQVPDLPAYTAKNTLPLFAEWAGLSTVPTRQHKRTNKEAWRQVAKALCVAWRSPALSTAEWNTMTDLAGDAVAVLSATSSLSKVLTTQLEGLLALTAPKPRTP